MFENDRINQSGQSLIMDCQPCWRQTKGLIAAVAMIALAGCQPATMPSSSIPGNNKNSLVITNSTSVTRAKITGTKTNDIKTRLSRIIRPRPDQQLIGRRQTDLLQIAPLMQKNLVRTAQPILPRQMRSWIRSSGNFKPMIK